MRKIAPPWIIGMRHGGGQRSGTLPSNPDIDVIDICTPPAPHADMVNACMQAGKHVICEKPFTGYFGRPRRRYGRCMEPATLPERHPGIRGGGLAPLFPTRRLGDTLGTGHDWFPTRVPAQHHD